MSFRNLTRPAVLKDAGVIIEPIRFSKHMAQHDEQVGRGVWLGRLRLAGQMQAAGCGVATAASGPGQAPAQRQGMALPAPRSHPVPCCLQVGKNAKRAAVTTVAGGMPKKSRRQ